MGSRYIVLLGKTGYGKSSTGNSLLGRKVFKESCSTCSVTMAVSRDITLLIDTLINVFDTPGLMDTNNSEYFLQSIENIFGHISEGVDAFVLVLKYGQRFTSEDDMSLQILKRIFGSSFLRNHCIIVITHGEWFDSLETGESSFQDWCRKQEGSFKQLLRECNERIVMFYNKTKDEQQKRSQQNDLLEIVEKISKTNGPYQYVQFLTAGSDADIMSMKLFAFKSRIKKEVLEIRQKPRRDQLKSMEILKKNVLNISKKIEKSAYEINNLKTLKDELTTTLRFVEKEMQDVEMSLKEQKDQITEMLHLQTKLLLQEQEYFEKTKQRLHDMDVRNKSLKHRKENLISQDRSPPKSLPIDCIML